MKNANEKHSPISSFGTHSHFHFRVDCCCCVFSAKCMMTGHNLRVKCISYGIKDHYCWIYIRMTVFAFCDTQTRTHIIYYINDDCMNIAYMRIFAIFKNVFFGVNMADVRCFCVENGVDWISVHFSVERLARE